MKKLRVTIEGKAYDVLVEILDDMGPAATPNLSPPAASTLATPALVLPPVPASPPVIKPTGSSEGEVACPLTGKVVSIDVKVGDPVQEGMQVATVEAMKMNTYIYAPRFGRVAAILVKPGDGVEEGTVLLRIG